MSPEQLRSELEAAAVELGFSAFGVAPAALPAVEAERLAAWLAKDYHGSMGYLDRAGIDRCAAETLLAGAESVVMVSLDYPPARPGEPSSKEHGYVATYARGEDYHRLIRARLDELALRAEALAPGISARPFVDTAPLVERAFARRAGLGWYGKNTCLLSRGHGSYSFLGGLVIDQRLPSDSEVTDHCGSCRRCLDACPTDAFVGPYELDARRCISYLTIEHRGAWPEELRGKVGAHVFGCDICQSVCPWNRFATPASETAFAEVAPALAGQTLSELLAAALRSFRALSRGTAVTRAGKAGFVRNVATAMGNSGNPAYRAELEALLDSDRDEVKDHARWSLARLEGGDEVGG